MPISSISDYWLPGLVALLVIAGLVWVYLRKGLRGGFRFLWRIGLVEEPTKLTGDANLNVIIAVFLFFAAQIMAAIIVEDGKGVRPTSLFIYCLSGLALLVVVWFLAHSTPDRIAHRFGLWFVRAGICVLILFLWCGLTGRLPGQVPLTVVANDVDYADVVEPSGLPGLKMRVSISGRRYNLFGLFGSRSLTLDATFDDASRKVWAFAPVPLFEEKLPDGTTQHLDTSINLVTDHEYVSPIEFKTFTDGKNYQLTVFFSQFSEDYVKDVQQFKSQKDKKEKAKIIGKYRELAKDAQEKIAARHGIRIALHSN